MPHLIRSDWNWDWETHYPLPARLSATQVRIESAHIDLSIPEIRNT